MIIVTSLKGEYTEALKTAVPLADTRPGLPPRWGQRGSGHPPKFAGGVPARGWWQMLPNLKSMFTACYIFFFKQTLDSFPLHKNSADDFFLNITEWVIGLFWDTVVQMKANLELQAPTKTMVMTKTQIFKLWNEQSKTTEWHHGGYWKWGQ